MQIDTSTALYSAQAKVPTLNMDVEDKALKAQTDQFEAMMLKTLLDTSMKDEDPLYGKDAGDKIYKSMYRDELAKSSAGSFGFSQMLYDYLSQKT